MDVVLECFDTYLFDPIWAKAFPWVPKPAPFSTVGQVANATILASQLPTALSYTNGWEFVPASQWWNFPPTVGGAAYLTSVPRNDPLREFINLYIITALFGGLVYFSFATLSYIFVFDKETFNHPKYLKNQMYYEIKQTLQSIPSIAFLTTVCFWLEQRGYSRIYDTTEQGPGMWYNYAQVPMFICFTDFCIYWIHRGLHHPWVYKHLHKPHHKWIMPTPFASHAFHPLDGFAQSIPYHLFPFLFPLQKYIYISLFVFINLWTVMIHDGEYVANSSIINGAACHTMHHLYFNYNYGQFTTLWDRLGGSYRQPNMELFEKETKMSKEEWGRQKAEMERLVLEVEGKDDRAYTPREEVEKKLQ